ncbi:hypothetical protein KI387_040233, partial [Taxus chinensis]
EVPHKAPSEATHTHPLVGQASAPAKIQASTPEQSRRDVVPQMHKVGGLPFNIVDQMKKTNINVTMWDALTIPSQRDLLHEALANFCVDPVMQKPRASVKICQEEEKQ